MSQKLYLYRPGQKALKLSFTVDDIPILQEWYELHFPGPDYPKFSDLELEWKNMFAKTVSFARYRVSYLLREFILIVLNEFIKAITKIKNFFR